MSTEYADLVGDELVENDDAPTRDDRGRFLPGHPLKSPGRPKQPTRAEQIRALLEPHREDLIGQLMRNMKSEDGAVSNGAIRLALDYLAPKPKPESEHVQIDGLAEARTLTEKALVIAAAVAQGELSVESAEKIMRMLDIVQRSAAIDDLRREVEALKHAAAAKDATGLV